jgi:hypothetical protein
MRANKQDWFGQAIVAAVVAPLLALLTIGWAAPFGLYVPTDAQPLLRAMFAATEAIAFCCGLLDWCLRGGKLGKAAMLQSLVILFAILRYNPFPLPLATIHYGR